ncbi:MAG: M6 family metalloprotease domain-containing protein [Clostridia bacterium]|nr:M6 family metalloprotease domain-containing protein [Clostridia bacterium]
MNHMIKNSMKALVLCLLSSAMTTAVWAAPANPLPQQEEQADGTVIEVTYCGDEYFNWAEEENGYIICFDEAEENWCYAALNENNELVPGSSAVGCRTSESRSSSAQPEVRLTYEDIRDIADVKAESRKENVIMQIADTAGLMTDTSNSPAVGSSNASAIKNNRQDMLLLLIEYTDVQMVNDMDFWTDRYFGTEGRTVNNYYAEQSGDLNLQFRQITFTEKNGSVTLEDTSVISSIELKNGVAKVRFNKPHPTYANKKQADQDVATAFSYVKDYIDFSKYTGSAVYGGLLLQDYFQVAAVVAGWEGSAGNGSRPQRVWAHANTGSITNTYPRTQITVNISNSNYPEYTLFGYLVHGELYSGSPADGNARTMGVGVSVHELGHCLGMPDLYDLGGDSGGISVFSVMSSGNWGAAEGEVLGERPIGFDAWSKVKLGFASPTVISDQQKDQTVVLKSGENNVLKLTSSVNSDQYFLAENRQFTGYDAGFYTFGLSESYNNGGIFVYHIDEAVIVSSAGVNSNRYHNGVGFVFADGSTVIRDSDYRYFRSLSPFFRGDGYNELSVYSYPSAKFYTDGHSSSDKTATNYNADYVCHEKTVNSGISLEILSKNGSEMTVLVNEQPLFGDVDSDGSVTAADRMLLARYLAGWTGYDESRIDSKASDVNQDGCINMSDVQILGRYFAGWNGYGILPVRN